ncbi:MAG: hypothetical protein ABI614_07965 [Planctomycetota bacterium]
MDSTQEYLEKQRHRTSVIGDLKQVKTEGGATAAELREFLSKLKGRSPDEVMGVVANSNLFRSTLTATVGCVAILIVFTVVPYAMKLRSASVSEKPAAAIAQPTNEAPVAATESAASTSDQAAAASPVPDLERAAKAMGIGGPLEADPKTNPLDNKLDKLLDGIE